MLPSLHVDPAAVRAVAAAVEGLVPALRVPGLDSADLDVLVRIPRGPALVAEHDRIAAAVVRAGRELAELAAGLNAAADAVAAAESAAVRSLASPRHAPVPPGAVGATP